MYPEVSILVSAHNEEKNIEKKIISLLALDYPEERLEILIGSDGSTDRTNEIVAKFINGKIRLYVQNQRSGKPGMLNMLVKEAKGEILVFTDARQRLDKDSLKELVKNFGDARVGSVSSALCYENVGQDNKTGTGVGLYWKYEKFIRHSESRMGSMLGATGALYAIRKELFSFLPQDLLLDDVYIPMKIVEKGFRAVFEPKAIVYDIVFDNPQDEFIRRRRTLAGNFQLFYYLRHLFNPLKGKISWQFFSHKLLRLIVPLMLGLVFMASLALINNAIYRIIFWLQCIFYLLAILGLIFKQKTKIFDVPYMFCLMNTAAVAGFIQFITGSHDVLWQKASTRGGDN
jgi:cellulose synthase/poly-beta-1,6-N-acetylglucosamine synthase-like glycosyltransferase